MNLDVCLYFAYGSNMYTKQMKERLSRTSPFEAQVAVLRGYRLVFNKARQNAGPAGNIVYDPSGIVFGVIYTLNQDELKKLDKKEGVHSGQYGRTEISVETVESGKIQVCTTYIAQAITNDNRRPDKDYLDKILNGAREHRLPESYIDYLNSFASGINVNLLNEK